MLLCEDTTKPTKKQKFLRQIGHSKTKNIRNFVAKLCFMKKLGNGWFHVLAIFAVLIWGTTFVATKMLITAGLHPTEIFIYRFIIAYVCILFISPRKLWSDSWRDEALLFLSGITGGSLYFITENTALQYTLVTNVSLLVTLAPILTVLLTKLMYKTEKFSKGFVIGSTIAFFGVACVIFNSSSSIEVKPVGDILSIAAPLSFAIYCIVAKKLNARYDTLFITRKIFFYGLITALPFLAFQEKSMDFGVLLYPITWVHLGFLGIVCSMLAYIMWNEGINNLGASRASNYLYLSPVITLIASILILNEPVTAVGYIGCGLTIGGVIVSEKLKI